MHDKRAPAVLDGFLIFVTGASSGIGEHAARLFAASGAAVALGARRTDRIEANVARIRADGGEAFGVALDVTDEASVEAAFARVQRDAGRPVDVVLNNAGFALSEPALRMSPERWRSIIDTNLTGPFIVAQAFARRAVAAGIGGAIVNVASVAGQRPVRNLAAYGASKAGLLHLTQTLAAEWARYNIRVNAIAPGYIETDLNHEFFQTPAADALRARIPQRRLGEKSDLDGALLLLASSASSYMTGSTITIDGGISLGDI